VSEERTVNSPAGQAIGRVRSRTALTRTGIFAYDLLVLTLLIVLGALAIKYPDYFKLADGDIYALGLHSMWFGSLGGVIVSLKGIYDHSSGSEPWDSSFNLWHLGRPASGAIAGLMTIVLLKAINPGGQQTEPVVYAAAFIFGTQERRFFNFLYEVARLIVQVPSETKPSFAVTDVQPTEGAQGAVIIVTGQGIERNAVVKLGSSAVENLIVSNDGTSAGGIIPSRPLGADTVDVVVTNSNGQSVVLPGKFKFSA
jgi:hypothetical protein